MDRSKLLIIILAAALMVTGAVLALVGGDFFPIGRDSEDMPVRDPQEAEEIIEGMSDAEEISWFDPYDPPEGECFTYFNMLTDGFAYLTDSEDVGFYFAIDDDEETGSMYFTIVSFTEEQFAQYEDIYNYTFGIEPVSFVPDYEVVSGVAQPIDEDLRDLAIEYFNTLWDEDGSIGENEFDLYFGYYYLDAASDFDGAGAGAGSRVFMIAAVVTAAAAVAVLIYAFRKTKPAQPQQNDQERYYYDDN